MTVEDLIEELMKQPLTAPVFIAGVETLYEVESVDYESGLVTINIDDSCGGDGGKD